jgi:hypothetical protein
VEQVHADALAAQLRRARRRHAHDLVDRALREPQLLDGVVEGLGFLLLFFVVGGGHRLVFDECASRR